MPEDEESFDELSDMWINFGNRSNALLAKLVTNYGHCISEESVNTVISLLREFERDPSDILSEHVLRERILPLDEQFEMEGHASVNGEHELSVLLDVLPTILEDPDFDVKDVTFKCHLDILHRISDYRKELAARRCTVPSVSTFGDVSGMPRLVLELVTDHVGQHFLLEGRFCSAAEMHWLDFFDREYWSKRFLSSQKSLQAMTLVHRTWTSIAQRWLRKRLSITGSTEVLRAFRSPFHGPWLQDLRYSRRQGIEDAESPFDGQDRAIDKFIEDSPNLQIFEYSPSYSNMFGHRIHEDGSVFSSTLRAISSLSRLKVLCINTHGNHQVVLTITGADFLPNLIRTLCALDNLETLVLSDLGFEEVSLDGLLQLDGPHKVLPSLRSFFWKMHVINENAILLHWLFQLAKVRTLHRLGLEIIPTIFGLTAISESDTTTVNITQAAENIINAISPILPTLEELKIDLSFMPYGMEFGNTNNRSREVVTSRILSSCRALTRLHLTSHFWASWLDDRICPLDLPVSLRTLVITYEANKELCDVLLSRWLASGRISPNLQRIILERGEFFHLVEEPLKMALSEVECEKRAIEFISED